MSAERKFVGKPEAKEYRVILAEHQGGVDLIVKTAEENIRKLEEHLQDWKFLGRLVCNLSLRIEKGRRAAKTRDNIGNQDRSL